MHRLSGNFTINWHLRFEATRHKGKKGVEEKAELFYHLSALVITALKVFWHIWICQKIMGMLFFRYVWMLPLMSKKQPVAKCGAGCHFKVKFKAVISYCISTVGPFRAIRALLCKIFKPWLNRCWWFLGYWYLALQKTVHEVKLTTLDFFKMCIFLFDILQVLCP